MNDAASVRQIMAPLCCPLCAEQMVAAIQICQNIGALSLLDRPPMLPEPQTVSPADIFDAALSGPPADELKFSPFLEPPPGSPDTWSASPPLAARQEGEAGAGTTYALTVDAPDSPRISGQATRGRRKTAVRQKKHQSKHQGKRQRKTPAEAPHVCSHPGCAERYRRQEHLNRHVRTTHKGESYQCHCRKWFSRKDNLKSHCRRLRHRPPSPEPSVAASFGSSRFENLTPTGAKTRRNSDHSRKRASLTLSAYGSDRPPAEGVTQAMAAR